MSAAYRVTNWSRYNHALIQRGSLELWIAPSALSAWRATPAGQRGAPRRYSNIAIETTLTVRTLFRLPLRATQGFVGSVFHLLKLPLTVPNYTTLSRRAGSLGILLRKRTKKKTIIIVDSSGVKVFGKGEWNAKRERTRTYQNWKKIHVAIDEKGEIRAVDVTENSEHDAAAALTLLPQETSLIHTFIADGAYDKRKLYRATDQIPTVLIPPRIDAQLWSTRKHTWRRDAAVALMRQLGKPSWKKTVGYHRRSRVEATMFRWKTTLGDKLRSREATRQHTEVRISANILNRFWSLGMPTAVPAT